MLGVVLFVGRQEIVIGVSSPGEIRPVVGRSRRQRCGRPSLDIRQLPELHHAGVGDKNGVVGLVASRFDREVFENDANSLPVEDGCQVLGRYPADKYNLDTIEVIAGLAERCTAPRVARLQLMSRFLLSYLAGDGDFHARSMSIMRSPTGIWEPTPVRDIVCTALHDNLTLAAPCNGFRGQDHGT